MLGKIIYAEVTVDDDLMPVIAGTWAKGSGYCPGFAPRGKGSHVVLVANSNKVVIRVTELSKRDRRLSPAVKWRLVQENFPIGTLLNADTHIFDGSVFKNSAGQVCFMMAALPKAIAEPIGEMAEKWIKPHKLMRLDTIEHMMFRQFAHKAALSREPTGPQWLIFRQSQGFRILQLSNGLPQGAYYISDNPEFRAAELERVWKVAAPENGVILMHTHRHQEDADTENFAADTYAGSTPGLHDSNGWNKDLWIRELLQGMGAEISFETFQPA